MTEHTIPASSGFMISAAWRSSGKTLASVGLARAALRRNLQVQTFKKGPDYIDPLWLAAASGNGCYNLDPYIQDPSELLATFKTHTSDNTLALVEGTMGLHDGLSVDGSDSNAAIARCLGLPVILVVDCRGMHRTVAALINGIQQFEPDLQFAGVLLNRIRTPRHEEKIRAALQRFSAIDVLGVIPESKKLHVEEQQLGLTPTVDCENANSCIDHVADLITDNCDLDVLFGNCSVRSPDEVVHSINTTTVSDGKLRIGLARDEAFHFYYQDDLDHLHKCGVEVIELSPIHDDFPDDLDGLIIGGGFPERHARALQDNSRFRQKLKSHVDRGLVVHAECAGLMYMCRSLQLHEQNFEMADVIPGVVEMCRKPPGRGYMKLCRHDGETPIPAHEFHHSSISFDEPPHYLYKVMRGHGVDGSNDVIQCKNVHASYAHFRHTRKFPWVDRFLERVHAARFESKATGTHS